ncbi:MAG: tRNA (adenosine(37)-N6)-threonylcarbamoyltransferase complex ATPase subunit type 1 TsaE [Candidatus Omnitrophica bacterium]|nr:tRNA (adenosine(37)-N6)-threonylcarbamoyltransferase complex ATPase subunit type 1 TsaE [Candidatus Omnitrophota bacterium]
MDKGSPWCSVATATFKKKRAAYISGPFLSWVAKSAAQTRGLGRRLAAALAPGDVLALCGDLGSGKTTFVQGIARGLGVTESVTSPSFVLVREYAGRHGLPVYHLDLFRLNRVGDLSAIGYDEYVAGQGVTLIEWAQKMPQALPRDYAELTFAISGPTARAITVIPHGPRAGQLVHDWKKRTGSGPGPFSR